MKASPAKVPAFRCAWKIASTSKAVSAIGFSIEDMLAGLRRLDRPFGVARMRRRDVDRLDLRIVEQRLVSVEDARAGERLGEARLLRVARADRDELPGPRALQPAVEILGDGARPDDAPANAGLGSRIHDTCPWGSTYLTAPAVMPAMK